MVRVKLIHGCDRVHKVWELVQLLANAERQKISHVLSWEISLPLSLAKPGERFATLLLYTEFKVCIAIMITIEEKYTPSL